MHTDLSRWAQSACFSLAPTHLRALPTGQTETQLFCLPTDPAQQFLRPLLPEDNYWVGTWTQMEAQKRFFLQNLVAPFRWMEKKCSVALYESWWIARRNRWFMQGSAQTTLMSLFRTKQIFESFRPRVIDWAFQWKKQRSSCMKLAIRLLLRFHWRCLEISDRSNLSKAILC